MQDLLGISEPEAQLLLTAHRWKRARLEERWWDDTDGVRNSAGVRAGDPLPTPSDLPLNADGTFTCPVTLEDVPPNDIDGLPCGHWFSREAWRGHIASAMADPQGAVVLRCLSGDCNEMVRPRMFQAYLPPEAFATYKEFVVRGYAASNPTIRWCPHPGCEQCVVCRSGDDEEVACAAGHAFCFGCGAAPHKPASCREMTDWERKNKDEGQDAAWILANTKPCPKCRKPIERSTGCNKVVCDPRAGGCGVAFCWMCGGEYAKVHDYPREAWQCNKPPAVGFGSSDAQGQAKAEVARFMFYFDRVHSHEQALKFAVASLEKLHAVQADLVSRFGVVRTSLLRWLVFHAASALRFSLFL